MVQIHNSLSRSAHGKVILSGEHSAVYGYPAVVAGCDLEITVTMLPSNEKGLEKMRHFFDNAVQLFQHAYHQPVESFSFSVTGRLPIGAGLGSSAALAYAVFQVLAQRYQLMLSQEEYLELVQASETYAHGQPSGLDAVGTVMGGLLRFQRLDQKLTHQPLENSHFKNLTFFLINSGLPQETSKEMIAYVAHQAQSVRYQELLKNLGKLTEQVIEALSQDRFNPEFMSLNQDYLQELGIVSPAASEIIKKIKVCGGTAKITGAGGLTTGSGMILAYHTDHEKIAVLSQEQEWPAYQTSLGVV